jgi:putative Ca2+/H+ antiporter (TMEM165/GDT1 family)
MYRVNSQTGQGFKIGQFSHCAALGAGGLHLHSRVADVRGAGIEVNTFLQGALIHDGYERPCHATPGILGTQTARASTLAYLRSGVEAFLVSCGAVALAELGDKTQLLALVLAARFRAPVAVILGILTATLANHFLAGVVGTLLASYMNPVVMRWILAASFIATALWMLIPDRDAGLPEKPARFGAYGTTAITFFLVEMGDKTQIATAALAARYHALIPVVAGTVLGMMLADVPVVLLGEAAAKKIPLTLVHRVAAAVFMVLGVLMALGVRT